MQSSEPKQPRTAEEKAKLADYMRSYRKRKKLATAPAIAIGSDMGTPDAGSSPVAAHLGPHGYPAD